MCAQSALPPAPVTDTSGDSDRGPSPGASARSRWSPAPENTCVGSRAHVLGGLLANAPRTEHVCHRESPTPTWSWISGFGTPSLGFPTAKWDGRASPWVLGIKQTVLEEVICETSQIWNMKICILNLLRCKVYFPPGCFPLHWLPAQRLFVE